MSYSQKHSGKVLVPWFNKAEWWHVYTLLSTRTRSNDEESLRILKSWKIRTPLLSAGVEGTMIVLEALLSGELNSSDLQMRQMYAISLLRFLNICAGNSDKQGTFNRTATKNGLPKWIIDIRHDLAHGHELPSRSMLQLALEKSLNWLMEKYWADQNEKVSDFVVSADDKVFDTLSTYLRLKQDMFREVVDEDYVEELMEKVKTLMPKKNNKSETDLNAILNTLEVILKQSLSDPDNRNNGPEIAQILTNDNGILFTNFEVTDDGVEIIPRKFRDMWSNFLNIMLETGYLFHLLNKLLEVTNNTDLDIYARVASLWITEIFNGLLKLQAITEELERIKEQNSVELDSRTSKIILKTVLTQKNPEYKDCIEFEIIDRLPYAEAKLFEEDVLRMPNKYTEVFLERVMIFNKNTEEYIEDAKRLVKSLSTNDATGVWNEDIKTIHDLCSALNLELNDLSESHEPQPVSPPENIPVNIRVDEIVVKSRWTKIKDTSLFEGLPLGVLPNESREESPVLIARTPA